MHPRIDRLFCVRRTTQINNGDVTNDAIPVRDLFKHDFW